MKSGLRVSFFVLLLVSAAAAFAQTKSAPATAPAPTVTEPAPQLTEQLTELERTRLENLQLKFQLLQQQQQQLQQSYADTVRQIQTEHPGYIFDAQTSTLRKQLAPTAAPSKAANKH